MKLAISNIAWTNEEELDIAKLLKQLGVSFIEVAPTKKWQDPLEAPQAEVDEYKKFWQDQELETIAFQSMLFNRPDFKIFESEENRRQTLEYLQEFTKFAGELGARVMVFGSPKNRQKGNLSNKKAFEIAVNFFKEIGKTAERSGVVFCIEPNPTAYNCDFVITAEQGIEIVKAANNPGFGLHLDIAGMALAGDSVADSIKAAAPYLHHFHISAPYLEQVEEREDVQYEAAIQALREINYNGFVSIEMKPGTSGQNLERVKKAVTFIQSLLS
jgi:D-psicose/D-tagatose/L-ribulose 3-epimerase